MTSRQAAARVRKEMPEFDREAYSRGWRSSRDSNGLGYPLDAADARGEPDEWYQGYLDLATGREKWHLPLCREHHNGEGGCGLA